MFFTTITKKEKTGPPILWHSSNQQARSMKLLRSQQAFKYNAAKLWLSRLAKFCQSVLGHLHQEPSATTEEAQLPAAAMQRSHVEKWHRRKVALGASCSSPQLYDSAGPSAGPGSKDTSEMNCQPTPCNCNLMRLPASTPSLCPVNL